MPGDGGNGAADGLLQVLRHPPVVFFLKVANRDETSARTDSELSLGRSPADAGGGTVNAEEDESGFPTLGGGFPDVRIAVWNFT